MNSEHQAPRLVVGLFHGIFADLICGSLRIAGDSEIDVLAPTMKFTALPAIATLLLAASALPASAQTAQSIAANEPFCFMQTNERMLDLTSLCGAVFSSTTATFAAPSVNYLGGSSFGGSSRGSSGDGNCEFEWQLAADGSRCGARAASARPGGDTAGGGRASGMPSIGRSSSGRADSITGGVYQPDLAPRRSLF